MFFVSFVLPREVLWRRVSVPFAIQRMQERDELVDLLFGKAQRRQASAACIRPPAATVVELHHLAEPMAWKRPSEKLKPA